MTLPAIQKSMLSLMACTMLLTACQRESSVTPQKAPESPNQTQIQPPSDTTQIPLFPTPSKDPATAATPQNATVRIPPNRSYIPIPPKKQGIAQNPLIHKIPASSFFILASSGDFNWNRPDAIDFCQHISNLILPKLNAFSPSDNSGKAVKDLLTGIFRALSPQKLQSLGIANEKNPHFVLYFAKNIPVLKLTLDNPQKFKNIVRSYFEKYHAIPTPIPNLADNWLSFSISNNFPTIAIHWGKDDLTLTFLPQEQLASAILPDILLTPPDGKDAYGMLEKQNLPQNAAAVAWLDIRQFKNNFAALEGSLSRLFQHRKRPNITCVKEISHLIQPAQSIMLGITPLSGGSVMAWRANFQITIHTPQYLSHILTDTPPRAIPLPTTQNRPMAQIALSIPTPQILKTLQSAKSEFHAFQCLSPLNAFLNPDTPLLQNNHALTQNEQFLSASIFDGSIKMPGKFSAALHGKDIAIAAVTTGLFTSNAVSQTLNAQNEENSENVDNAPPQAVLEFRDFAFSQFPPFIPQNAKLRASANDILISNDYVRLSQFPPTSPSPANARFHIDWSERFIDAKDDDNDRDYHIDFDISTTSHAIELAVQYAIE